MSRSLGHGKYPYGRQMSRWIHGNNCQVCFGEVRLDEGYDPYEEHYDAPATCTVCGALYVAMTRQPVREISFRHARNDEPSAEDLPPTCDEHNPDYVRAYREIDAVVKKQLEEIAKK